MGHPVVVKYFWIGLDWIYYRVLVLLDFHSKIFQIFMEHILDNAYTNRDFEYLKSKNVEVCIIIQHKVTKEISMRSSVPLIDVKSMLQKTDRDKEQSQWVSEHQRKYFPKSDGPITNVFNNKGKLIVMASKVMCFWKEVGSGQ